MPRNLLIQVRRDTSANWVAINPILAVGEFAMETDTGRVKVGDGTKPWVNLGYLPDTLSNNVVTNNFLRDSAGLSVIGRSANTAGDPGDIVATSDHQVLRRSGNSLEFGQIVTGGIVDGAVTSSKIANGTIVNADISASADIAPSKLGAGNLPNNVKITTPSYDDRSVTHSKLNDTVGPEGVGVWQTYTPVITTENGESVSGKYNIVYAKYMKINYLMSVNVLIQFTNSTQFSNVIYVSLPQQPTAPSLINLGTAYHLNSDARPNMPPIVPINYEGKVAFLDHRGQYYYNWYYYYYGEFNYPYYWWWDWFYPGIPYSDEQKKGFYLGTFEAPDRLSFDLTYEVS